MSVDVRYLNADFFVFSGHKVFGPTGIGVVYGKEELLNQVQPWQGGGIMIKDVTFERTVYHPAPSRFEAGTGNIADALLQQSFGEFHKRGTNTIGLGVDASNPTGTTRLYQRAGMVVASEFLTYEKELRPGRVVEE